MSNNANYTINKILLILFGVLVLALFYALRSALVPFVIAALLAYLFNPLVYRLMKFRISRIVAVSIVFSILLVFIVIIFLLLIPLMQKQIELLNSTIPKVIAWFQQSVPSLMAQFGMQESVNPETLKNMLAQNVLKAGGTITVILKTMLKSGKTLFEWMLNLVLIPIVTFYLLRDWEVVLKKIRGLLPKKIEPTVVKISKECDNVLSAFFRGQLLVMISLGIFYALALSLTGLQTGILIGFVIGIVSIVPYLGVIIGIVIATVAALVQYGTLTSLVWIFIVFIVGHAVENFFLTPKLIGDRVGLHPVVVIFAILAGGSLFGFFGVLLALPAAAIIMVLLRHLHAHYYRSTLYNER